MAVRRRGRVETLAVATQGTAGCVAADQKTVLKLQEWANRWTLSADHHGTPDERKAMVLAAAMMQDTNWPI
jgi:hypothetical protein